MRECSEPGCRYPAIRDYNGLTVCHDCFSVYKDKEIQANDYLRDIG
ncbi:hypothetical protein HQ545_03180 [Candidatus Woesearchaeota archaeon]|nr:hypothetical protein [Candidatus Woesearchaeota archaeon]